MAEVFTPYSTIGGLTNAKPSWISDPLDQLRIMSYQVYEELYWNVPGAIKLVPRGSNEQEVYIPSAMTIVDTQHRWTAPDFKLVITASSDLSGLASTKEVVTPAVQAARLAFKDLFKREKFRAKYNGNKRYGLIWGDWIWHITADPLKPPGTRISITALDPGMYFPINDPDNVDKVIGCHLVEQITTPDGPRIRRLTYRRAAATPASPPTITVEDGIFKVDKWGGPMDRPEKVLKPPTLLPGLSSIPVYHVKNGEEPGNPFGSSSIRGLERLILAINQSISDEDLTMAMDGLGVWVTDAPPPMDPLTRKRLPWRMGPGSVLETPGAEKFERISGVSNLAPYGDHIKRMVRALREGAATPDIAVGSVDVQVPSSGVALALQLGPILARAAELTDIILGTHDHMFYDILNQWMPAYEQTTFDGVEIECMTGDPVPVNREERFAELTTMLTSHVIDTAFYRQEATKLGYEFPEDMESRVLSEVKTLTDATDILGTRIAASASAPNDPSQPGVVSNVNQTNSSAAPQNN